MRGTAAQAARAAKLAEEGVLRPGSGLLMMPPVLPLDMWEALAMAHQTRLAADSRPELDACTVVKSK